MKNREKKEPMTTCCFCGQMFIGYGNNPFPLIHDITNRCCDRCNEDKVIPSRLALMCSRRK